MVKIAPLVPSQISSLTSSNRVDLLPFQQHFRVFLARWQLCIVCCRFILLYPSLSGIPYSKPRDQSNASFFIRLHPARVAHITWQRGASTCRFSPGIVETLTFSVFACGIMVLAGALPQHQLFLPIPMNPL